MTKRGFNMTKCVAKVMDIFGVVHNILLEFVSRLLPRSLYIGYAKEWGNVLILN